MNTSNDQPYESRKQQSVENLFKFFCNNLYLGQWQLAKASLQQLHRERGATSQPISEVVKDVATYPFNRSVPSESVTTPNQLAWLCLLEYNKLNSTSTQLETDQIDRELIEFRFLLIEACSTITDIQLKELYTYHRWVHSGASRTHSQSLTLSPSLLKYLQATLSWKPELGHALITSLVPNQQGVSGKNFRALQHVYTSSINTLLDQLKETELDNDYKQQTADKIYEILSLFDPGSDISYLPIKQLLIKLLDVGKQCEYLRKDAILSVLIGHADNKLVEGICRLDYEGEINNAVMTYQSCAELTEEQRCLLHLSSLPVTDMRWKMFFLLSLKKQRHLLELIMETGLSLIKCGMFEELQQLLSPYESQPLKPLLLLLGWTQCYSSAEARQLLQTLWGDKSHCHHPAITMGCNKLAYQIDLIQWCIDKTRSSTDMSGMGPHYQRAAEMFRGLENHSVLYVLHQSTKLSALDQREVLDLLHKVPLEDAKEEDIGGEKKKTKSVRFEDDEPSPSAAVSPITSLDQKKDIAIYTGYCVLKSVMDAIVFCLENGDTRLTKPVQCYSRHRINRLTSYSSNETDASGLSRHASSEKLDLEVNMTKDESLTEEGVIDVQGLYRKHVTEKLNCAKSYLAKMQPLTFRVEIMEDVFSLLFLTHEDIQETVMSEYNSDEVDDKSFRSSTGTGVDSPSPRIQDSLVFELPKVAIETTPDNYSNMAYDVPFEDVQQQKKKPGLDIVQVEQKLEKVKENISKSSKKLFGKKLLVPRESQRSSFSENISSVSNSSNWSLDHFGFILNEYLVRDILALLKDGLLDVSAAKFQLYGSRQDSRERVRAGSEVKDTGSSDIDTEIEEPLSYILKSSISKDALQKRITQLQKYTSEAQWRYQLVVNDHIPKQVGEVLKEQVTKTSDTSDEEVEIRGLSGQKSRKRKKSTQDKQTTKLDVRDKPDHAHSDSSAGEVFKRQKSRLESVSRRHLGGRNKGVITLMLSSPVTLLTMSIRKGNFTQTKQIIKLCKLEERPESMEVYFSQAFQKASRSIQTITPSTPPASSTQSGSRLSMKLLANVAAAGVANVSVSNIADELLGFPTLPKLPKIDKDVPISQHIKQNFVPESIPVIILMDLMCTAGGSWEVCNHIMDSIKTRLPENMKSGTEIIPSADAGSASASKKHKSSKIQTFTDVLACFEKLLHLGADEQFPHQEPSALSKQLQKSVCYYLNQAVYSLDAEKCKQYAVFCQNMTKYVGKVQEAFKQQKKLEREKSEAFQQSGRLELSQRRGSTDSVRSRVGSNTDQPVVHHRMKQLIHILEKEIPEGGLIALMGRYPHTSSSKNKNYLLSLYEHCRELAYLVSESESMSRDTAVVPKNYFVMLEEGPIRILGRMMFNKKMPPAKLERVAKKLSLNLTHIIVYSCCVKVPSKRLPVLPSALQQDVIEVDHGKVIHNCTQGQVADDFKNAEEIVRDLLTRLINLMKDIARRCHAEGLFDSACADMMVDMTEYNDIISRASLIQSADLLQLTNQQRRCFFGNLQTFMTIHCHMTHLHSMKKQREADVDGSLAGSCLVHYSEMSVTDQITWLNMFAYRVGQLGAVSLFVLKYIINRCSLPPPSEWGKILEHRLSTPDKLDPLFQLAPTPDPQLLFAMTTCCVSSAPIQILEPEQVKSQLGEALRKFLQATVVVNKEKKLVKLPELLLWHRRDFISDPQYSSTDFMSVNEDLVSFIVSQLDGEKEKEMKELLSLDRVHEFAENINSQGKNELPFDIEVVPYNKDFLCVFDFESVSRVMKISNRLNSSVTSQKSDQGSLNQSGDMTYNMTPNTLEYIKSDCPLVATLVSLVCSDEFDEVFIEDNLNEGHFGNSLSVSDPDNSFRSGSPSAMSLVDIRSYRYEKLTYEYPYLKRHLLNYFIPLAVTEDHEILKGDDPILKLLTSDMMERFKSSVLSLHESNEFRTLLTGLLNELFAMRKWAEVLNIIHSVPVMSIQNDPNLQSLHDFVLCCSVHTKCNSVDRSLENSKSKEVATLIHGIYCTQTQARVILEVYRTLQIDNNIELFEMCLNKKDLNDLLREAVEQKFQEVKVFYRITECAKNLQIKLSLQSSEFISDDDRDSMSKKHKILERFTDWSNVVEWTQTSPRDVLALLIKAGDFDTAKSWCGLQKLSEAIRLEIEENHVIHLLNCQPRNTTKAFQVLEQLKADNAQVCLSICQKFVEVFNNQRDILFISSYILNQLSSELDDQLRDQLRLTHIGSRIMMFLPETMHIEYSHLVTMPRFLLEQLIMNMKTELVGKAFHAVKEEFQLIASPTLQFAEDQFNTLVALYARKALEFTVIQSLDMAEKERTFSKVSVSSSDRLDINSPRESPLPRPVSDNVLQKRKSVDFQASTKPHLSVSQPGTSSPGRRTFLSSHAQVEKFVMPSEPPTRDQWTPDAKATVCMVCKVERFSMFNRRHHCRRCGRVVCASCSGKTTLIRGVNARTCEDCYGQIVKQSDPENRELAEDMYHQQRLSGASLTTQRHTPDYLGGANFGGTIREERPLSLSEVVSHTQAMWKLQTDDNYNATLREDFFFEQAPSTSLCISILNLHGNPRECGQLILRLCDDLSNLLKPLAPGVPNPEVDYSLIMSMMKYLLFHAKMKFIKTGENQGMAQCDMYQGLVDLLGLFVTANYKDLPSLQELTKMDSVRRLRDKLIEDERLLLAMEVSTKCGLDPSGVWVAMGMTCLQSGDFPGAREKFSKCLRPQKDKNVCTPPSKLLENIIDSLETMPGTGSMEIQLLLSTPGAMKNLISTPASTFFEEASMDSQQFQECLFYLRTYGSYLSVIDFHRRHGYYMKAVQYILDHKCSADIFVEGLLKPLLESGELARLTDQMMMIDPSLEKWNSYLTAACRYFVKNKLHHVLYEFQIFMKDFIRASVTCYTYFYQQGAQSYIDLARKIQYLFTAQQHMQAYLDPAQWGNVQHPLTVPQRQVSWERGSKGDSVSVRLVKDAEEVKRFIKTIALQIEVTKYLQTCLTSGAGEAASVATAYVESSKLPTLFSSSQARTDLTIMILLSGEDIATSFSLANRIIMEYKLGAVGIYTHAAREMAKNRHYGNMRKILDCVIKAGLGSDDTIDEIVGACLLVVADNPSEAKEADNIIKLLRKDQNKINAYILCGKLKSAYLMAVKDNNVDDVKRILRAANSLGQTQVINICNKWLAQQNK